MTKVKFAVAVLILVLTMGIGSGLMAYSMLAEPASAVGAPPDSKLPDFKDDLSRLPPEATRLYAVVKKARPGELKWLQIPWLVDLQEGLRLARQENRPLLMFVSGDDPLEKC